MEVRVVFHLGLDLVRILTSRMLINSLTPYIQVGMRLAGGWREVDPRLGERLNTLSFTAFSV